MIHTLTKFSKKKKRPIRGHVLQNQLNMFILHTEELARDIS